MSDQKDIAAAIVAMERAALDRWGKGDPGGYLAISAPEIVYFDPFLERRLNGLDELASYYSTIRGQVRVDRDHIIEPHVQLHGDVAVLTFNYISYTGETSRSWNCTEVYKRQEIHWRIIQTHWSLTAQG